MNVGRWREATSWSNCFPGAAALSRSRLDFSARRRSHVAGAACIASRSAAHPADQHAPVWGPPPRRAAQLTPGRALARARQAQHAEGPPGCCNGSTLAHGDAHVAGAACIASRSTAHPADQHAPVWGPPPRRAAQLTPGRALARARQAQHAEEPPGCCNGSRSSRPSLSQVAACSVSLRQRARRGRCQGGRRRFLQPEAGGRGRCQRVHRRWVAGNSCTPSNCHNAALPRRAPHSPTDRR